MGGGVKKVRFSNLTASKIIFFQTRLSIKPVIFKNVVPNR